MIHSLDPSATVVLFWKWHHHICLACHKLSTCLTWIHSQSNFLGRVRHRSTLKCMGLCERAINIFAYVKRILLMNELEKCLSGYQVGARSLCYQAFPVELEEACTRLDDIDACFSHERTGYFDWTAILSNDSNYTGLKSKLWWLFCHKRMECNIMGPACSTKQS